MKKKNMKKISVFAVALCTFSIAAAANNKAPQDSDVTAAIKQLGAEIHALAVAGANMVNNAWYQLDQNLFVSLQAHVPNTNTVTTNTASATTQQQLSNSLIEFPEQVVNASQLTDPQLAQDINDRQQRLANLTTNLPASDTLYSTDPLAAMNNVAKPSVLNDNDFDFDALAGTDTYATAAAQQAAAAYITYAAQTYQSNTDGIDFAKLKSMLNNLSPDDRAKALKNFMTNPTYQQYQLSVRSTLAAKSAALSNLNTLMAERTPVAGLGKQAGMSTDNASPLAVQNYIANERVNNPQWFQQMKTASPATVAREQVLILAEIESALQRNHLDNERILATLSMMALQNSQSNQMLLKTQAQAVNAVISAQQQNPNNSAGGGSFQRH